MEWQGFSWGCVKTQVKKRPWTHWYKLPFIDYGDTSGAQPAVDAVTVYTLGSRLVFFARKTKYFNEIRRNNSKQSQYYVKCTDNEKNMKKKLFKIIDFL